MKITNEDINILEAEMLNCYLYHIGGVGHLEEQQAFSAEEIEFIKKCMADEISQEEAQLSQFYELNRLLDRIVQLKEELLDMEDNQKNKHSVFSYKPILYAYLDLISISMFFSIPSYNAESMA
jgi:hypothetical protein